MLIVPVVEGLDWRRPPPVTLLLILLNLLVFFGYQSGDAARERRAAEAYAASSLPMLEAPAFLEHLRTRDPRAAARLQPAAEAARSGDVRGAERLLAAIESDAAFSTALRTGRIVAPADPAYARWKAERERVDALLGQVSARKHGFTPADPRLSTWFTSMFLHGDLMHLLGNMVFLFVVGVAVESAAGSLAFAVLYLAGGLAGDALFLAVHQGSFMPSVGASGAISGLMGAFTVIFGWRPVKFFWWLVVFGFVRLRGLVVLPVWIAYEALQFFVDRNGHVGYMAHAGGLMGGALLAFALRARGARRVERFHEEREREAFDAAEYERARGLAAKLDFRGASSAFARLAERFPQEEALLKQWIAVARTEPASDNYRRAVGLLLSLPRPSAEARALQQGALLEFLGRAPPTSRLEPRLLARAAAGLAKSGEFAAADKVVETLFRQAPEDPSLPLAWETLAHAYATRDPEKARRYRALLGARSRVASRG